MKKFFLRVIFVLLGAIFFIGCSGESVWGPPGGHQDVNVTDVNQSSNFDPTNAKMFKGLDRISASYNMSEVALGEGGESEEKASLSKFAKISNSLAAELQLREKLWNQEGYKSNMYIVDTKNQSYEFYDDLKVGNKYTLYEYVYFNDKLNFIGRRDFTFTKNRMNLTIPLDFYNGLKWNLSIPLTKQVLEDGKYQVETKSVNKAEVSFNGYIGKFYTFTSYGIKLMVEISYINIYNYLENGVDFPTIEVGTIGGISTSVTELSYERASKGIEIEYDSGVEIGKQFIFHIIMDKDSVLLSWGNNVGYYAVINGKNEYIKYGDFLPKGTSLYMYFSNYEDTNAYFTLKEVLSECSELEELLDICEEKAIVNMAVIEQFGFYDNQASFVLVVDSPNEEESDIDLLSMQMSVEDISYRNDEGDKVSLPLYVNNERKLYVSTNTTDTEVKVYSFIYSYKGKLYKKILEVPISLGTYLEE